MSKTFACKDLGGACDEKFSGNTFSEIMEKAMGHMMSDDAHTTSIMGMEQRTGENREQWMKRMQREFDALPDDQ